MKIYSHADDAGISRNATSRIIQCWEQGYIDGFSIIANEQCYDIIRKSLEALPHKEANISVHLNLTDGKCLSPTSVSTTLADAGGKFKLTFFKAFLATCCGRRERKKLSALIYSEWERQILSVKEMLGERVVFAIDTHNYIHLMPLYYKEFLKLADKYEIKHLRITGEFFHYGSFADFFRFRFWRNVIKLIVVKFLLFRTNAKELVRRQKSETITGVLFSGYMQPENVCAFLQKAELNGIGSVEIIYHPGKVLKEEVVESVSSRSASAFFTSKWRDVEFETAKRMKDYNFC